MTVGTEGPRSATYVLLRMELLSTRSGLVGGTILPFTGRCSPGMHLLIQKNNPVGMLPDCFMRHMKARSPGGNQDIYLKYTLLIQITMLM